MRKAIVMAGGWGTRLSPLTLVRPKPLVSVANQPALAHILRWLRRQGVTDVLLTLHYRAEQIREVFGAGCAFDLRLSYQVEETPLGTAGAVKQAEDWVGSEPFLIASGDALTDLVLRPLFDRHRKSGAQVTLGLKAVADPSAYGVVDLDAGGAISRFQEKPALARAISRLANTGIYCVQPEVLHSLPIGRPCDWSHDIFPGLVARGGLFGQALEGYWCDIGSMEEYQRGQRDALLGAVRVERPGVELFPGVWLGRNAWIAPGAVIRGPVLLGPGCQVERGAEVLPGSVIGEGAIISAGARIDGAVLGAGCQIGPGAVVKACVLDDDVRIGTAARVDPGAVLGTGCRIDAGARVARGRRIEPDRILLASPPALAAAGKPVGRHLAATRNQARPPLMGREATLQPLG